ncbi:2Fe-2S iron-sulfur cluster binding domain-containing protein [Pseudomonas flavescens]|uniref:2Fe-2S iron-sulfur cluster binding domain-containing protein n=1 Tax=Phytopseudomonas flavescens TaxID=29435 RepID=A0A1G7X9V9_9GAMM|nr:4Fe-4S dicluster domain-containing protein [Pseudomonas flavescens]SDG80903.1 2Fe-2S iron-sulfur cluster binding domain-containing protein [Pseudomonas flavescens]
MSTPAIQVTINGELIQTSAMRSILEAVIDSGHPLIDDVGCMGQGVCGSCRVLIRRAGEREVSTALACETRVEPGLQISFLDHLPMNRHHTYDTDDWNDTWSILERIDATFPEAKHCRHCGGCDRACPKGLEVQKGVNLAAKGNLAASQVFDECIMCNLCTIACPEHISPNHLGIYIRRMSSSVGFRPADLMQRLRQIDSGVMQIDPNVVLS